MHRVKQKDSTDCAVASLISIIKYYKGNISYEKLRNYMKCDKDGVSAYDLINAAKIVGFDAKGIKCTFDDLPTIKLPCIAHVTIKNGYNHYIVLEKVNKIVSVYDPFLGNKKYSKQEFENIWNNVIITMNPINLIIENEKKKNNYYELIKKYKKYIIILVIMTLSTIILSLIGTYYFKILIDNTNITKKIFIIFSLILSIRLIIDYIKNNIIIRIESCLERDLMFNSIDSLLSLQENYFVNKQNGDILSRINSVENIKALLFKIPFISIMYLVIIIFCMLILVNLNITIFIYSLVLLIIYIITHLLFHKKNKEYISRINEEKGFSNGLISEIIDGISSIRKFDLKKNIITKFNDNYNKYIKLKLKYESLFNTEDILKNSILLISLNYLLFVGTSYLSVGNLILFYMVLSMIVDSIKGVFELEQDFNNGLIAIKRFGEILGIEDNGYYSNKIESICFDNVYFAYKNGNNILNGISFSLTTDDRVLFKGNSGSGKTTIFNLIQRKYFVDQGIIILGKENINKWSDNSIKELITYVSINEKIFKGSVEYNICFGNINKSKLKRVMDLCLLNISEDLLLEEDGSNISLGEKSKLLLCRSLYKKSNILIIDELLSNIGIDQENYIIDQIISEYKNIILIYSSHRSIDESLFNKIILLKEKEGKYELLK